VELKKSLIALRKEAETVGLGGGQLVSREVFDRHFEFVLVSNDINTFSYIN
jgi:hypothetical protein